MHIFYFLMSCLGIFFLANENIAAIEKNIEQEKHSLQEMLDMKNIDKISVKNLFGEPVFLASSLRKHDQIFDNHSKEYVTLADTLRVVLREGLHVQIAHYQYEQQSQNLIQAWSRWVPTVSVSSGYSITSQGIDKEKDINTIFDNKEGMWNVNARITQPIFSWLSLVGVGAAHHIKDAQRYSMLASVQNILLHTIESYLNVLTAQVSMNVAESRVRTAQAFYESMEKSFAVGHASKIDKMLAKARLLNMQGLSQQAYSSYVVSLTEYHALVGKTPVRLTWPQAPKLPSREHALLQASHSPNVLAKSHLEQASRWEGSGIATVLLPTISGQIDYGNNPSGLQAPSDRTRNIRVSLQASLAINPLQSYAATRSTLSKMYESRTQSHLSLRVARHRVVEGFALIRSTSSVLSASVQEWEVHRSNLKNMKKALAVGALSLYDFYSEEDQLWASRLNALNARKQMLLVSYGLLNALGLLTPDTMFTSLPHREVFMHK